MNRTQISIYFAFLQASAVAQKIEHISFHLTSTPNIIENKTDSMKIQDDNKKQRTNDRLMSI